MQRTGRRVDGEWPKARLVEVEWVDASSRDRGWDHPDNYVDIKEYRCKTVGYMIHRDKKELVLMHSVSFNGLVDRAMHIPARYVKRVHNLK